MDKKFAVIGLGRFGGAVASSLYEMGVEVIAVDKNRGLIDQFQDKVTYAVAFDATNRDLLADHGVDEVDCAVVGIGEHFEANVLVTSLLHGFEIPVVITRAYTDLQREILRNVGATQILSPEEEVGTRLAKSLVTGEIVDFLELPNGFVVRQVTAPKQMVGKTLAESEIRKKYVVDVIVVKKKVIDEKTKEVSDRIIVIPDGGQIVEEGDILGIIGREEDIERFS